MLLYDLHQFCPFSLKNAACASSSQNTKTPVRHFYIYLSCPLLALYGYIQSDFIRYPLISLKIVAFNEVYIK
ncbi:unnamed protein product [Meloidogyne enterolobii]|uniref:Uncharacterized protein n=1 Tax=Meloidogyne enterolobii TaxID=390850 RepID=A0ACB1ALZ4_MELEN